MVEHDGGSASVRGGGPEREWPAGLDVAGLVADGWRPVPFREFVLKIYSRCNLGCDYCYVYEMADQSWRFRSRRMPGAVLEQAAARIAEHVAAHRLDEVTVVLHGGEPTLAGARYIERAVHTIRRAMRDVAGHDAGVAVRIHTNGTGLTTKYLRTFDDLGIRVSVSLDGDAAAHDRHRRRPDGAGSHARVSAGLSRLTAGPYRRLFAGLLCTVDLANDPVATYESLLSWRPPTVDFLLPHGNWDAPPPGLPTDAATPYADWLTTVFDRWYEAPRRETQVRLFSEIMHIILGGAGTVEGVGLSPTGFVTVETDGDIEQADTLKSAYTGAAATGLHVSRDPFDAALLLPSSAVRQIGVKALSAECAACPVHHVCGGGLYAHRYRAGSGFANPSVYCRDLFRLIKHIHARMAADLLDAVGFSGRSVEPG
jgi:uncharacterized protein